MKRIQLMVIPGDPPLDYKATLVEVVSRPLNPAAGASIDEVRQSIRVLDALEVANGTLELEDADYRHMLDKLKAQPWGKIDRRVVQFVDDVSSA